MRLPVASSIVTEPPTVSERLLIGSSGRPRPTIWSTSSSSMVANATSRPSIRPSSTNRPSSAGSSVGPWASATTTT